MPPKLFTHDRGLVTDSAMDTLSIVEDFDVVKQTGLGRLVGRIAFMVDEFSLKHGKEAFHGCIVVAVAGAAHADLNLMFGQQHLIIGTRVLAATV